MAGQDKHPLKDYAFWLIPMSPTSESAQGVITELTKSETQSPIFSPHITLFHPVPKSTPIEEIKSLLSDCIKQSALQDKLCLSLKPAQAGTHYYQSVLAPVTPHEGLSRLRKACEEGFKVDGKPPYFPHLSLLYGDLSTERRNELAEKVNKEEMALMKGVEIREIAVVDCTGTADKWKTVASVFIAQE